jgi:hypothetical protein
MGRQKGNRMTTKPTIDAAWLAEAKRVCEVASPSPVASRAALLIEEVERLRTRLLSAAGDDLCRLSQEEIKAMSSGAVKIPPKAEFLASCERFHAQVAKESGVLENCLTLAQLIAENEKLREQLAAAERRARLPMLAAALAHYSHRGQTRKYNGRPYIEHPMRVATAASLIDDVPAFVVAAAWLHDVIEDCGVTAEQLAEEFPAEVVSLVVELTNPSKQHPNMKRADRKCMDRSHIARASRWAKVLKLIDRTDNMRDMIGCDDDFLAVYGKETCQLRDAIGREDSLIAEISDQLTVALEAALAAGGK